jgi:hypothetical protein
MRLVENKAENAHINCMRDPERFLENASQLMLFPHTKYRIFAVRRCRTHPDLYHSLQHMVLYILRMLTRWYEVMRGLLNRMYEWAILPRSTVNAKGYLDPKKGLVVLSRLFGSRLHELVPR